MYLEFQTPRHVAVWKAAVTTFFAGKSTQLGSMQASNNGNQPPCTRSAGDGRHCMRIEPLVQVGKVERLMGVRYRDAD